MLQKPLKLLLLCLTLASLTYAQGLMGSATKDDWEEINFAFDSAVLVDGFPSLLRLAELLNQNSDYKVELVGHTDYLGSSEYNLKLANERANSVRVFLEKYGARPNQISIDSRGKASPKIDARSDEARWVNRRVEMSVKDGQGRLVSAGGVGDAIKVMEKLAKQQEDCCNAILAKLDKLDEILAALNDLKRENASLRDDLDKLKAGQTGLKQEVAELPKAPSRETMTEVADETARKVLAEKQTPKFSILGMNVGTDSEGDLVFTGKGRFFAPFQKHYAVQAEAEYMRWDQRREGQFDIGLLGRYKAFQLGAFSSFKHVSFADYQKGATLGQASFTGDYIFNYGKVGAFGSIGFMGERLIDTRQLSKHVIQNTYAQSVDQVGGAWTLALWDRNWFEGNFGYLDSRVYDAKPGGTFRLVFPFADRWAFTAEGGVNETLLTKDTTGRWAVGVRFGDFMQPKRFAQVEHPVPADIPRVRYELLTRTIRTGNDAPVAVAGPDLIGVKAGPITLDGSASYDPDGDPITFEWAQVAGPAVALAGATTATASFTAEDGQVYGFRLMVQDDQGGKSLDRITVSTKDAPKVRVVSFTAAPDKIVAGQPATLTWSVEDATSVSISGVGDVDPRSGTTEVMPAQTTVYTLTATNAGSESRATVTVVVDPVPEPSFLRCMVTPANIREGESASIQWETANADQVYLSGFGSVALTGSQSVSPLVNTSFTLTATNSVGSVTCPLTIQVTKGEVPQIITFTANKLTILNGDVSTLVWQVQDATEVFITEVGSVNITEGKANVRPAQTTVYNLTARNQFGEVSANVGITVLQPARVVSFTVVPTTVPEWGDAAIISWETVNASSVVISPNLGPREASGSITVRLGESTTYSIVASNALSEDTATASIQIPSP